MFNMLINQHSNLIANPFTIKGLAIFSVPEMGWLSLGGDNRLVLSTFKISDK